MKQLISSVAMLSLLCVGNAAADTVAIVGGKIHTVGPQGMLERATILIEDGRILAVGSDVEVPDSVRTIDASGKVITPGLYAAMGHFGLGEVELSADPVDSEQAGEQFTAGFDVADAFNPRATHIAVNRIEGVTRATLVPKPRNAFMEPSTSHVISGLGAVVHLGDGNNVQRRAAVLVVQLGAGGSTYAGGSRAAAWLTLRQALDEARTYADARDDYERDEFVYSARDLEALGGVLEGETRLVVRVDRASDIEVLLGLVREYGLRAIIAGGSEAWMVADKLAAADVPVVLDPTENLPGNFDRINERRENATILNNAGVRISFVESDSPTHNARNITQLAGNAVADGMPWEDALRSITLTPAEMFGVADTVGSIETGKLADIVIWPGDPLELMNYPDAVFINGESIPMISRQTLLRDRYVQQDASKPPALRAR
jgi:imidazolonepropionase-like amidohydrolase